MAEIKIEKKKPVWPWILLAIVLVGIAYFIYATQENDDYNDDADSDDIETMNGAMDSDSLSYDTRTIYEDSSYVRRDLMEVMKDSSRFGTDTTYTKMAFYDLAERTFNMAKRHNLHSSSEVNDLEHYTLNTMSSSATTTQDTKATSASQHFKTVSTDIVEVIEMMESNHAPRMQTEVEALKKSASEINAATDMSKQQSSLQAFIRKAHELLNNLNS